MLIIPELKAVVIQPPRTGSTALRLAVLKTHPKSFQPYRHMERDGIPFGYERWTAICVLRRPEARLRSLHRYLARFEGGGGTATPEWKARLAADAGRPFADWLECSPEVFCDPWDSAGNHYPQFSVMDSTPIARKSLWRWARPDLGPIEYLHAEDPAGIETRLHVRLDTVNASCPHPVADLPGDAARIRAHLHRWFTWDIDHCDNARPALAEEQPAMHRTTSGARTVRDATETTRARLPCRFGHDPNPAVDYITEVGALQKALFDAVHGRSDAAAVREMLMTIRSRIARAMDFRVGGDPGAVLARQTLRSLECEATEALGTSAVAA